MAPRKILNSDPLRLRLTKSGTELLFNTCDITIITILNFKISWGGGDCGWGSKIPWTPPYETLVFAVYEQAVIKISRALIPKLVQSVVLNACLYCSLVIVYSECGHAVAGIFHTGEVSMPHGRLV